MDIFILNLRQMISYALEARYMGKPLITKTQLKAEIKKIFEEIDDE